MKILIYTNHLARASQNATAITIMSLDIAKALRIQNHEVYFAVNRHIIEEDIDYDVFSLNKEGSILNGELPYAKRLADVIKTLNPSLVLAFMKAQNIVLSLSKMINDNKDTMYVGSIHNNDAYFVYGKTRYIPYRYLIKSIYENLDFIIVPSKAIKEDLQKTFFIREEKLKIIPNCIDFSKIEVLSKEPCDTKSDFINIGRLIHQKGQIYLIEAFKIVKSKIKDARLVIIGEGELRKDLEAKIKALNLEDSVILTGYATNPYKYLKNSKIFVLSSIYEGFGNVLIEAMYMGLPVIAFDSFGGHTEIIDKEFGILIKEKDQEALANAMIELLTNEEKRKHYALSSLERAKRYACEHFVEELLGLNN